jgi:hypothetical protein
LGLISKMYPGWAAPPGRVECELRVEGITSIVAIWMLSPSAGVTGATYHRPPSASPKVQSSLTISGKNHAATFLADDSASPIRIRARTEVLLDTCARPPHIRLQAEPSAAATRRRLGPRYEAVLPACRGSAMKTSDERILQCNAKTPSGFTSPSARCPCVSTGARTQTPPPRSRQSLWSDLTVLGIGLKRRSESHCG